MRTVWEEAVGTLYDLLRVPLENWSLIVLSLRGGFTEVLENSRFSERNSLVSPVKMSLYPFHRKKMYVYLANL